MTAHRGDIAQWTSNGVALLFTLGLSVVILWANRPYSWRDSPAVPPDVHQPSIEVSLQQSVADKPRLPEPPAKSRVMQEHRPVQPRLAARSRAASPAASDPLPDVEAPIPEGGAPVAAEGSRAAAATADPRPDLEAQYAAGLRADIDRRTHPPDTVQYRLRRPSGEVRVAFILRRDGEIKSAHVLRSSGSSILDEAAIAIVASGHYPPMSASLFTGEAEHTFSVTIEFRASS